MVLCHHPDTPKHITGKGVRMISRTRVEFRGSSHKWYFLFAMVAEGRDQIFFSFPRLTRLQIFVRKSSVEKSTMGSRVCTVKYRISEDLKRDIVIIWTAVNDQHQSLKKRVTEVLSLRPYLWNAIRKNKTFYYTCRHLLQVCAPTYVKSFHR